MRVPTTTRFNIHDVATASVASGNNTAVASPSMPKTSLDKTGLHQHQQHKTKKPNVAQTPSTSSAAAAATFVITPTSTTSSAAAVVASSSSASSHAASPGNENSAGDPSLHHNDGESSDGHLVSVAAESNSFATQPSVLLNHNTDNYFCGPKTARNLFWNTTRVGEVNVQPCPGN